jgi:hypothetical protein
MQSLLFSNEVFLSDNTLKHEYCKIIQDVKYVSKIKSKKEMIEILKNQVEFYGGNALIHIRLDKNNMENKTLSAKVALCDFKKSPLLFTKDLEENNSNPNSKLTFSIIGLYSQVTLKKEGLTKNESENNSNLGIGLKVSKNINDFTLSSSFTYSTGIHILANINYNIPFKNKIIGFIGPSLGYGKYNLKDSNDNLNGLLYGVQAGFTYNKFTFGLKYLKGDISKTLDNVDYTIETDKEVFVEYRF